MSTRKLLSTLLFGCILTFTFVGCVSVHPPKTMYVGSYARVPVVVRAKNVTFDDLAFRVVGGPAGGTISICQDKTFDPAKPTTMLIAGYKPGKYTLEAVKKASGEVVAKADFEVHTRSPGGKRGPSLVVQGMHSIPNIATAWGGGPSGPQNMGMNTATGTRRIAVILADTNEERYTTNASDLADIRDRWMDNLINGVDIGGTDFSLRRFYREGSNNRMDVSAQIFGPYQMNGNWDQVGAGAGFWDHCQAAITAADSDINYNNFDSVLVVSQSVGAIGSAGTKFAWPTASIGEWNGWVTAEGNVTMGSIQMPVDWTARDGREVYATASHELGHNLGHGDTYTPAVAGRNPGGWDLMDNETHLPNFNLPYRMRLGWVDASWIKCFNFAGANLPVDETVTLKPLADGNPGTNRYVGAEVRVSDGFNYYFEYRKEDTAKIADRNLPTDNRVLGVDAWSGAQAAPYARPAVLLLPNEPDSDGPVLGNGNGYYEKVPPVEFHADVSGIDGTKADLRIRYGVFGKPDPSLRPWGAPPWQSPDIEVRNARNAADPAWANVPWTGNSNDVIAKVKNGGDLNAPGVRVDFSVKDFTITNAPEFSLGSDTKDVNAGATVEFKTTWVPPGTGHYCIIARIPLYTSPGTPPVTEMTELNNQAQSNYSRFISDTSSPARRKVAKVLVKNPYKKATRIFINAGQTNPYYRTYLEHKWLDLGPGEQAHVNVMFEYAAGPPHHLPPVDKNFRKLPNHISVVGLVANPHDRRKHQKVGGGISVEVVTGRATKFKDFNVRDNHAQGTVVTVDDGKPVKGGMIILTGHPAGTRAKRPLNQIQKIARGTFSFPLKIKIEKVKAYYLPPAGYGDSTSKTVSVKVR